MLSVSVKKPKTVVQVAGSVAFGVLIALIGSMTILLLAMTLGPKLGFYQTYSVLSGSMEPTLGVGSMIILEKVQPQDLQVGDIVSVTVPELGNRLVTHRIVELKKTGSNVTFQTKGDANNQKDGWIINTRGAGVGWRYVFGIPWVGYLLAWMQAPIFRLLLVGLPSLVIGMIFMWDIWKPKAVVAQPIAVAMTVEQTIAINKI